jgi:hypothetical protein
MTYTKPEINLLGDAAQLIQFISNKMGPGTDAFPQVNDPAYDLDE